jgi:hypothetical protein
LEPIKLVIGLPSGGTIRVETAKDMALLLANTGVPLIFDIATPQSCYIHMNRERCVEYALEMGADYLLFIDSDMTFLPDSLAKLLALNVDISSATYNMRKLPKCSVVKLLDEYAMAGDYDVPDTVTERPIPLEKIPRPFRCGGTGGGFLLIKMDVFKKVTRPWFFFTPQLDGEDAIGEDIYFCNKARITGYEIWIDPSVKVGHIGSIVF